MLGQVDVSEAREFKKKARHQLPFIHLIFPMSFPRRQTSNNEHYKGEQLIILNSGKILGIWSSLQKVEKA